MQEPLPVYSENHHKLARALAPLAGSQQSYSRAELVRQVRRMFPELSKNDLKPQKHCLNYSISSACACSRSTDALFEKLETPDGSHRYRVLSPEAGSQNRKTESRPQPAASAFARAPVTPSRRPEALSGRQPFTAAKASQAASAGLSLDLGGLLPRLKQWIFGEKPSRRQPQKPLRSASSLSVSRMSLPPLPPLPPLPVVTAPLPATAPPAPVIEDVLAAVDAAPVSAPSPVAEPVAEVPTPVLPVLQVMRLPAPGGVQRLMIQHLNLDAGHKLHLKLSPAEAEASLELVHLHFRDSVVKELAVIGDEPLEVGFRLLGQPGSSRILIHGLCEGAWQLLQTSEQSFPILPEPMLMIPAETAPTPPQAAEVAVEPAPVEELPVQAAQAPVQVPEREAEASPPQVEIAQVPETPRDPLAWLDEVPELYRPLMQHIQTHGSLGEAAMIGMLGGGNAGARKARAFAVQVDSWQGVPFEIEIVQTPEGKTYQKV